MGEVRAGLLNSIFGEEDRIEESGRSVLAQ